MSAVSGLAAIPWRHVDTAMATMWLWETPHFEAKVTAEPNAFYWELGDLVVPNQGAARFLAEGRAADFTTAEAEIREAVGKSYPPQYGYARYAGALATTFTLAGGRRVDLGAFNGQRVVVTVRLPQGGSQRVVGHAQVVHYELRVETPGGVTMRIQPAHIDQVVREGGGAGASAAAAETYTGAGRIYRGSRTPGCTGTPGFLPDTIDHTGARCPVHEAGTGPRFAPR